MVTDHEIAFFEAFNNADVFRWKLDSFLTRLFSNKVRTHIRIGGRVYITINTVDTVLQEVILASAKAFTEGWGEAILHSIKLFVKCWDEIE